MIVLSLVSLGLIAILTTKEIAKRSRYGTAKMLEGLNIAIVVLFVFFVYLVADLLI